MKPVYQLNDVRYRYPNGPALEFWELHIDYASVTAIVGPNGSGKTTLLNILGFIDLPEHGSMRFFEQPVTGQNYAACRKRVGYIQQKPYLFRTTVEHNIGLGLKIRGTERQERIRRTAQIIDRFELGRLAHRMAHELSGGEAQKVALARTLVLEPDVLILDEPFSHLDQPFRVELEQMIHTITHSGQTTLIFTTHDQLQAQKMTDRILSLVDGRLVPLSVINMYSGTMQYGIFDTGKLQISIPPDAAQGTLMAIESNQIALSRSKLESSMRNCFQGRVTRLSEENGTIHVLVQAGELFHVVITPASLVELGLHLGDPVWISFKSTSVHLLR